MAMGAHHARLAESARQQLSVPDGDARDCLAASQQERDDRDLDQPSDGTVANQWHECHHRLDFFPARLAVQLCRSTTQGATEYHAGTAATYRCRRDFT